MIPVSNSIPLTGNPLAPEWLAGFCALDTPSGYEDLQFTYSSPFVQVLAAPTPLLNQVINIDQDSDFWLREFVFAQQPGNAPYSLGDIAIRFRDGRGRRVMDDYIVIDDLMGPVFPYLVYSAGNQLLFDILNRGIAFPVGIQLQFKGFKRRKL